MAKITLKGKIAGVGPVEAVGKNNTPKQLIILHVPGYVDGFGDKKGRDQQWCLEVWGDRVEKLALTDKIVDQKAEVLIYTESYFVEGTAQYGSFYDTKHSLSEIKIIP